MTWRRGQDGEYAAWAMDAGRGLEALVPRFTGREQSKILVDMYGAWMQTEKPEQVMKTVTAEAVSYTHLTLPTICSV
eukprot:8871166-Alexandrium_andersonii.AAC.1